MPCRASVTSSVVKSASRRPSGTTPAPPTPEAAERQVNSYTSLLARGMPSIVQERDYENKIAGSDFTRGSVFVRQDARLNWNWRWRFRLRLRRANPAPGRLCRTLSWSGIHLGRWLLVSANLRTAGGLGAALRWGCV